MMRNAWRECQEELQAAEAAWFDGDEHAKYLAWVNKWTAFVVIGLKSTADQFDVALHKFEEERAVVDSVSSETPNVYN